MHILPLLILLLLIIIVCIVIIVINKKTNKNIYGGKQNETKPVIILFNGFASSPAFWNYAYNGTSKLKKLNFVEHLNNIGDVYKVEFPFFNLNYYIPHPDPKEDKKWYNIMKNYSTYNPNINFHIEDLDYKNICVKTNTDIIKKFGKNRKIIVIGHSYGGPLALLYSKLFKVHCCVVLDSAPYVLNFYKKHDNNELKKEIATYNNDIELQKLLKSLKKSTDDNKTREIGDKIFKLIEYKSSQDRIKYYDDVLHVPTIFVTSINDDTEERNIFNKQCKDHFENDPNLIEYKLFKNKPHFLWWDQKTSNYIINKIQTSLKKLN